MDNGEPRSAKRSSARKSNGNGNGSGNGPADPRNESSTSTSRSRRATRGGGRVDVATSTPSVALADPPVDDDAASADIDASTDVEQSTDVPVVVDRPEADELTDVTSDDPAYSDRDAVEAREEVVEPPERIVIPPIVPATEIDLETDDEPVTEAVPMPPPLGDTDGTGGLPSKHRKPKPPRPLRAPVVVPRRRRPRVRRVTRVVRHVDTWSVFKIAVVFNAFLYGVCLTAGVLLWQVAQNTGTVDNIERFFESFGWETFELKGGEIYHNAWIAGLFVCVGLTGLAVLACTLFNLITDLVGGIRVSVLEEEVVAREDRGLGWRPKRPRRSHTVQEIPKDPPPVVEYAPPTIVDATAPPPADEIAVPDYVPDFMPPTLEVSDVVDAGVSDEPGPAPDPS